jgi:hypothetical protein
MNSLRKAFQKNGFIVLKNIINYEQVNNIRKEIFSEIGEDFQGNLGIDYVLDKKLLFELQFNDRIINSLKEILSDKLYYINDIIYK